MTPSEIATRRVAEDRRREASRSARREAWAWKWREAARVREGWTADQLQAEETELMAEVARRVSRGDVQKLASGAALNPDDDLLRLLKSREFDD